MNLFLLLLIPLFTSMGILLVRKGNPVKWVALIGSLVQLILCLYLLFSYQAIRSEGQNNRLLFEKTIDWYRSLGVQFHMGVDGISIAMILLTALVVLAGVLVSWKVEYRSKEFFFLLIFLSLGAYGFFISFDLFSMFFFLELAVMPKFLLIGIWGSGKREYSAMKLALMLMGASALLFVGIIGIYYNHPGGAKTGFDFIELSNHPISASAQQFFFPFVFVGFGIFTALFPFHTWVPDGHSSAPTAASMFLAGISMKLGGYGCLRVATLLMPEAAKFYSPVIIILASIAILYGAFATMMQTDLKYINAYSSVSHCGFVLLGIGMLTETAIRGAILQMVSHGLMTALFFAAIGMVYDRTHNRLVSQLGGLLKMMPYISVVFVIAGLCSLGLPGLSGFVAEMTVFIGSWQRSGAFYRVATIIACASIVVTAVYVLRAVGSVIMGPVKKTEYLSLTDARWYEKSAAVILAAGILLIGMAPFLLNELIKPGSGWIMERIQQAMR